MASYGTSWGPSWDIMGPYKTSQGPHRNFVGLLLQKFSCFQAANSEKNYKEEGRGNDARKKGKSKKEIVPVPLSHRDCRPGSHSTEVHQTSGTHDKTTCPLSREPGGSRVSCPPTFPTPSEKAARNLTPSRLSLRGDCQHPQT